MIFSLKLTFSLIMFQNMVASHKYTKLIQSCINLNVQRCYLLPTIFNFDFIFTLTQLLYYKILQIMNNFDNIIWHVKVPHMAYSSIFISTFRWTCKRKKYSLGLRYWTLFSGNLCSCCTLLDCCLKNHTTLWNIWTYQLLSKKNYTTCVKFYTSCVIFLTLQLVSSYVSQCCVIF